MEEDAISYLSKIVKTKKKDKSGEIEEITLFEGRLAKFNRAEILLRHRKDELDFIKRLNTIYNMSLIVCRSNKESNNAVPYILFLTKFFWNSNDMKGRRCCFLFPISFSTDKNREFRALNRFQEPSGCFILRRDSKWGNIWEAYRKNELFLTTTLYKVYEKFFQYHYKNGSHTFCISTENRTEAVELLIAAIFMCPVCSSWLMLQSLVNSQFGSDLKKIICNSLTQYKELTVTRVNVNGVDVVKEFQNHRFVITIEMWESYLKNATHYNEMVEVLRAANLTEHLPMSNDIRTYAVTDIKNHLTTPKQREKNNTIVVKQKIIDSNSELMESTPSPVYFLGFDKDTPVSRVVRKRQSSADVTHNHPRNKRGRMRDTGEVQDQKADEASDDELLSVSSMIWFDAPENDDDASLSETRDEIAKKRNPLANVIWMKKEEENNWKIDDASVQMKDMEKVATPAKMKFDENSVPQFYYDDMDSIGEEEEEEEEEHDDKREKKRTEEGNNRNTASPPSLITKSSSLKRNLSLVDTIGENIHKYLSRLF